MTDEQWVNLTAWLKLPPEARAPIENELDLYARVGANAGKAPSETRKKLERVAALADDLLKAIEEFGPEEHQALRSDQPAVVHLTQRPELAEAKAVELASFVGRPRATPRLDTFRSLAERHAQLSTLRDHMMTAAATIAKGKTGRDASNVRALVRGVSKAIEPYTGKPLGKGKPEFDFVRKLCKLADPEIREGSIKGAIEDLTTEELAPENSSNAG